MNCGAAIVILLLFGHCAAFTQVNEDEVKRCRCHGYRKDKIPGIYITQIDIFPRSRRCRRTEIIARLIPKYNSYLICVERTAPWLKILIEDLLANTK
ncbi:C-X-C motif chemokine 13-like [Leucoraja erinacea]|uniref:C-X-C motif chemokine 13-like n=1 Tax=Leucoraja erinaceus TaxID=7782 RepID=UPI002458881B|nr:C-X-C motif chemokine 13-like [Leucoraja erinacea]